MLDKMLDKKMEVSNLIQNIENTIMSPWITFILLFAGMMFIVLQASERSIYGGLGIAGVIIVASVYLTWMIYNEIPYIGIVLLLASILLLIVESYILPGSGFYAGIGILSMFSGTYLIFNNSGYTFWFPVSIGLFVSLMYAIAFIVHLPNNEQWSDMYKIISNRSKKNAAVSLQASVDAGKVLLDKQDGVAETVSVVDSVQTHVEHTNNDVVDLFTSKYNEIEAYAIPILRDKEIIKNQLIYKKNMLSKLESQRKSVCNASALEQSIKTCKSEILELQNKMQGMSKFSSAAEANLIQFQNDLKIAAAKEINAEAKSLLNKMYTKFNNAFSMDISAINELERRANAECDEADSFEYMSNLNSLKAARNAELKKRANKSLNDLKTNLDRSSNTPDQELDSQELNKTSNH